MSKTGIAQALGVSRSTLNGLLAERQAVTPVLAIRLAAVFGTSAASRLNMQTAHDLWKAEREVDVSQLTPIRKAG
jgi:addiction module HigA family antidote